MRLFVCVHVKIPRVSIHSWFHAWDKFLKARLHVVHAWDFCWDKKALRSFVRSSHYVQVSAEQERATSDAVRVRKPRIVSRNVELVFCFNRSCIFFVICWR